MDVLFKNERLRRDCSEDRAMQRAWGALRAKILRRRLGQLAAANTLEDMKLLHSRTHELKGDRAGQISLDLDGGTRLLIVPAADPVPRKADGGLDWKQITAIRVMAVEDTHD